MTHAFFKALLFLAAGVIILRLDREHDMFKMGGLRKELPLVFWTFLIGASSLAALPLVTAGFYSKDLILWQAWAAGGGSPWLWAAGLVGAVLTSLYTFRMVFLTFFGEPSDEVKKASPIKKPGWAMGSPLIILASLSIIAGFLETPSFLGGLSFFSGFVNTTLPRLGVSHGTTTTELVLELVAIAASLGGILMAYWLFLARRSFTSSIAKARIGRVLHQFLYVGWGFDWLYSTLIVRPYIWLATADRNDVFDSAYGGIALLAQRLHGLLSLTQTGQVRRYALGIAIGAMIVVGMVVLL